jgi:ABC-2 type transport system permease protein
MIFPKVLAGEFLKLRRSKITWLTFVFYVFFGLMSWFVFWILKNPDAARTMGLIGQKASFAMEGLSFDWQGLFTLFAEMGVAGGMIILSIAVIYLFGREYAEGTAKNMLSLPIPRSYFVIAKLLVATVWFALLTAFIIAECLIVGTLLSLEPLAAGLFAREIVNILIASLVILALQPLVAFVTVASSGYLAPFGYTIATLLIGNLMVHTLWSRWCPWSIVVLLGGLSGPRETNVVIGSSIVMIATGAVGIAATIIHQKMADNCQ